MTETVPPPANRSTVFGVLAVLIAGATAAGAWWVVSSYQAALEVARRPLETREVVAAARELGPGEVISETDLTTARFPVSTVGDEQFYGSADELVGGTVAERILVGEPIRRERLDSGIALDDTTLEPGTRAVTLRVERAAGVGGLVLPGAYVDVIVTIRPDANAMDAKWVTETIIQAVRVLAVGDSSTGAVRNSPSGPGSAGTAPRGADSKAPSREVFATLEVEPDEAEKLAMATSRGDVYLSLRPRNDFDLVVEDKPLVTNALVGIDARPSPARTERVARRKAAAVAAPPPGSQAEVISGSSTTIEHFNAEGERIVEPKKGK